MTVGVDELLIGVDEELPADVEELDEEDEELPPATVVAVEPDGTVAVAVLFAVLLEPAWSWDTATPMATVTPVAARTAPRVRVRSRALALSLLWAVGGSPRVDMGREDLCSGDHVIPPSGHRYPRRIRCGSAVTSVPAGPGHESAPAATIARAGRRRDAGRE